MPLESPLYLAPLRVRGIGLYIHRILPPEVDVFIAPQVNVPINGRYWQAHPQEPPEVYSNLLPPSVGETTGGIHPMPSGITISAPPEVNIL